MKNMDNCGLDFSMSKIYNSNLVEPDKMNLNFNLNSVLTRSTKFRLFFDPI